MKRPSSRAKRWEDHYSRRAKKERFPARSVYKLQEIQNKFNLIKRGDKVLDLGCSPGAWLLYAANLTGNQGQVLGIDLKPVSVTVPPHVRVMIGDILALNDSLMDQIGKGFNVVLSDMAPATTGNRDVDAVRSFNLCWAALGLAQRLMVREGSFVCKIFQGQDFKQFSNTVKSSFKRHKIFKPQSSRKASREIYVIGLGKK
jgi:23S rRNA (uridine2552-2'-O)-methyltransferase